MKFNTPLPARKPDTLTHEGGPGFTRASVKDELFVLGMANFVGEETFYETAKSRDDRFVRLIHEATRQDPTWTRKFIVWLRGSANMRSAPIVAAVEYVRAGGPNGRQLVRDVLQRPDEPAEMLGYIAHTGGKVRHPSKPIKRGIADSLGRLYTERNVLRYDGVGTEIRFGDVVDIVHPRAADVLKDVDLATFEGDIGYRVAKQAALYEHLLDRRHGRPNPIPSMLKTLRLDETLRGVPSEHRRAYLGQAVEAGWDWKRIGGWAPGGMDAEAWEAAIPNMGLMALVRNLRNFDDAGISQAAKMEVTRRLMVEDEVRRSRQFPLRFLTAWKAVNSIHWGMGLEAALNHSLVNVPNLPGRTLILVDISPSMRDHVISRRTDGKADRTIQPWRWEAAGVFGAALAQRAEHSDVVLFDFNVVARAKMAKGDSILRFVEQCGEWANKSCGTDILAALSTSYDGHDRVVILTDEQNGYPQVTSGPTQQYYHNHLGRYIDYRRTGWSQVEHIKVPVFTFNLGGYSKGVTPNERNWTTLGGLSDACFGLIPIVEKRHQGLWPWDVEGGDAKGPLSMSTLVDAD